MQNRGKGTGMTGVRRGGRRVGALSVLLVGALLLGSGCGKAQYNYVANQNDKTYFKVPTSWTSVDPMQGDELFAVNLFGVSNADQQGFQNFRQARWATMYDSSKTPDPSRLLSPYPTRSPVVYTIVVPMPPQLGGQMSLELMKNLLGPVSDLGRQRAAKIDPTSLDPAFELLYDQTLTPSAGLHGVREVYNQTAPSGLLHTYDLTVLTNNDSSVLYAMLAWCSSVCYRERVVEIDDIVSSFTVRSQA
jgi:hypothetical protein